ncbi:aldo/keto reductase [Alkalicoccobacillus murimartini]|uniref:Diketogulonate reductase-like aldo/keto reductase n=1 Tax=Alkalicoccobacillus murimartini TaxID=171685 RepID=A0ABT9YG39_9BACI|nr:aldo/keto reductase [Alkalicoccobacillus murimartini]MDQ0206826.1 diketogulonate reductase-like aldo/keto reductase [Alkalicoccobacillus murimartini]
MTSLQSTIKLNDETEIPVFGLGVYKMTDKETSLSVHKALRLGYRLIDTAAMYENEEAVGEAIREMVVQGIPEEEIYITTKVWKTELGYEKTRQAVLASHAKLGLNTINLVLIHWPGTEEENADSWRALEELVEEGKIKSLGVSNFSQDGLERLFKTATIKPVLNQVELHPILSQEKLQQYCQKHHIVLESWSPLMRGRLTEHPYLQELADHYNKDTAQIILRWNIQRGIIPIPKSSKEERIESNADIFDFELTEDEMKGISQLNEDRGVHG